MPAAMICERYSLTLIFERSMAAVLQQIDHISASGDAIFSVPAEHDPDCRTLSHKGMSFTIEPVLPQLTGRKFHPYRQILMADAMEDMHEIAIVPSAHLASVGVLDRRTLLPVFEAQLSLAISLGRALNIRAVGWRPSGNAFAFTYFDNTASQYLAGGIFPVLGFIALEEVGAYELQTRGLEHFCGHELCISGKDASGDADMTRTLVQAVHDMVTAGHMRSADSVPPYHDMGARISLVGNSHRGGRAII